MFKICVTPPSNPPKPCLAKVRQITMHESSLTSNPPKVPTPSSVITEWRLMNIQKRRPKNVFAQGYLGSGYYFKSVFINHCYHVSSTLCRIVQWPWKLLCMLKDWKNTRDLIYSNSKRESHHLNALSECFLFFLVSNFDLVWWSLNKTKHIYKPSQYWFLFTSREQSTDLQHLISRKAYFYGGSCHSDPVWKS